MYNQIRSRSSVVKLYGEQLAKEGILTANEATEIINKETARLEEELKNASGPTSVRNLPEISLIFSQHTCKENGKTLYNLPMSLNQSTLESM
jgi:2-oxoglutarate dehydrogenase complex dehydrogenase (E1) component-like enzyme